MITSAVFIALIGTLHFKPAISATINYEPIKITVNENFNAQPGQVSTEFQSLEPGVIHQGANFYFKPRFNLPSSFIPHHIEALMSLIQQHDSCAKDATKVVLEKDKLMEILMPFLYPKEALSDTVMEEENNSEIVVPVPISITEESKPAIPLSFNGIHQFVEEEVKKEESVILEETTSVLNEVPPIITYVEPKPSTSKLLVIPKVPVLSSLSLNGMPSFVEKEVKKEESIILEESTGESQEPAIIEVESKPATPELVIIPEAPILPTLSANDIHIVEKVNIEEPTTLPMPNPIFVDFEPKPKTSEFVVIPEAPVLPLSFNDIPSFAEEELTKKELITLEQQKGEFPTIPEITIGPIINYVEPKPKVLVIPEAPVLPPLRVSFNNIRTFVEEEMEKNEPIILEESTGVSQEPTIIEIEPKPATLELEVISEAPVLPPLSFNSIPATVEEEEKKEGLVLLDEPTGVSQALTIIEIEPKPTTSELVVIPEAPLSANDIHIVEGVKVEEPISLPMLESITVDIEPKPVTPELLVIPEAPMLPPLSFNGIPAFLKKEVKKEESVILEESTGVSQEPTIIEIEPKPATLDFEVIPEAPVLPPLSFNSVPATVEEEEKKEGSVLLDESNGVSQALTLIEIEPKPTISELLVIPEASVLPPLSANDIHIVERVKIEEPISLPMLESIVVDIEPKPVTPELLVIPEAPMLPPLSFNGIPAFLKEEVKKEESVILEESTGVSQEPIIIEVGPKSATPELVVIPEAPVLPPIYEIPVVEEVKSDESILLDESIDSNPDISARPPLESFVETETAKSLALENYTFPVATEEIKIEIPIILEESIEVFPPNAEISSGPTLQEPEITNSYKLEEVSQPNSDHIATVKETLPPTIIRKPSNNLGVFSYAPFLSHLSSRASKTKKRIFPKPANLERFFHKKHPFRLPVTPFQKLSLNYMKSPILGNKIQFLYPTSYAHNVVEKRIAPNMTSKKNAPPKRKNLYPF